VTAVRTARRRRFLVPEVVQTSAMDCGPASLKCLLEGFGVGVSYARLQEACQTDLDGTSIDTIEGIAGQLGFDAEQIMLPIDHLLVVEAGALPAVVVTRNAEGLTHFVVVWRRHGPFVQVMDPATGRRWPRCERFLDELYTHVQPVPAADWRAWASTPEFLGVLKHRLAVQGVRTRMQDRLVNEALSDSGWRALATLDAATRMGASLGGSGALRPGSEATRLLTAMLARARRAHPAVEAVIPDIYWSVRSAPDSVPGAEERLCLRGAVVVRVRQPRRSTPELDAATATAAEPAVLSSDLLVALREPSLNPMREVLRLLKADGLLTPAMLAMASVLAAAGVVVQGLLMRAFFELSRVLGLGLERLGVIAAFLIFAAALLLLDFAIIGGIVRLGRRLDARLRTAFMAKIPRLGDRYFQSRLISDMAQRVHSLHTVRMLPAVGVKLIHSTTELGLTTVAIAWLDPASAALAALAAVLGVGIPVLALPTLGERELRQRNQGAALSRFYLDALVGLVAIRTHRAEASVRREHEATLIEWARAGLRLQKAAIVVDGVQSVAGLALVGWLVLSYLARGGEPGTALLLVYWALNLPMLGHEVAWLARQYPAQRNVVRRILEPLGAPEDGEPERATPDVVTAPVPTGEGVHGVDLRFEAVHIRVAGRTILDDIDLAVRPREHTAIVGSSGAGKSTLVGVLLGWYRPAAGRVRVDDRVLDGPHLERLRTQTAWVDPAIQLWNRSLFDNLRYATTNGAAAALSEVIDAADLAEVLEKLPDGLQSSLGEGGCLTSGGEGQRVRLGRAMLRADARLVILDEPFRGLDRGKRRQLLARARRLWCDATLLCITHDVGETRAFDRVLVMDAGRIVEDGPPEALAVRPGSRYRSMLEAEEAVRTALWSNGAWRVARLEKGALSNGGQRVER
jgi:ABC-type bacteriocin/lantibiotic exporter with double-glycine peptidase domain